jgi:hypothetical protein
MVRNNNNNNIIIIKCTSSAGLQFRPTQHESDRFEIHAARIIRKKVQAKLGYTSINCLKSRGNYTHVPTVVTLCQISTLPLSLCVK